MLRKALQLIRRPFRSTQSKRVALWKKGHGERSRYLYDLNENSIVFDLGGYKGQWASDIFSQYVPNIYIFEPVKKYAQDITDRFLHNKKIKVFAFGLSNKEATEDIWIAGDRSSTYTLKGTKETIEFKSAKNFFATEKITTIDLMKINIEGGEYDLLEHLLETGLVKNIQNIQVQFHDFVPNAEKRMIAIQEKLKKTHHTTYQYPFVWENWKKN